MIVGLLDCRVEIENSYNKVKSSFPNGKVGIENS
jgi:hypothetical protein